MLQIAFFIVYQILPHAVVKPHPRVLLTYHGTVFRCTARENIALGGLDRPVLLFILQGLTVHALPILKLVFGRRFDRLGFSRFDGIVVVLHQLSGLLPGEVPEFLFTLANRIAVLVFTDDGIHLRSDVI